MVSEKLPLESESQAIGHHAVTAFNSKHPVNWRCTFTEGDSDVGLDVQIQVTDKGKYVGMFNAQIKGSQQKKGNSKKKLSINGSHFSQVLNIPTLNYYINIENPIMLVFADLTCNEDPRQCPVYYIWIDEELEKLCGGRDCLDHLGKSSHTFHIPTANILSTNLDVLPYLKSRIQKKRVLENLFKEVEQIHPDPVSSIRGIGGKIASNKIVLDSVLDHTDNPWVDAPKDSVAKILHTASEYISINRIDLAENELDKISPKIDDATIHEQSEYYYQRASISTIMGMYDEAKKIFKKAHINDPENKKYHLSYLESLIPRAKLDGDTYDAIIDKIGSKTDDEFLRLKAKILAAKEKSKDALELIRTLDKKGNTVIEPLIYLISKNYKKCIKSAERGLQSLKIADRPRYNLHAIMARALFEIGTGEMIYDDENNIIPFAGLPGMNPVILRNAWNAIIKAWEIAHIINYPREIEHIIDISAVLGMYFNEPYVVYDHLKTLCDLRPNIQVFQETLLQYALQLNDKKVADKQFEILPKTPKNIANRAIFYYKNNKKNNVVDLVISSLSQLRCENVKDMELVLGIAALCSDELFRYTDRDKLINHLKTLPSHLSILAIYEFITIVKRNPLDKDAALQKLYKFYKQGHTENEILDQLLGYLSPLEQDSAKKLIEVYEDIIKKRDLFENELLRVCQAMATLGKWKKVLTLTNSCLDRFKDSLRLIAVKALALDELGDTPAAIRLIEKVVNTEIYEPLVIETYVNISLRCGFIERALKLISYMFENESENNKKLDLLRMMYSLELHLNPENPKLLAICEKYGQLNEQNDEVQEGIYLLFFFSATHSEKISVTGQQKENFQQRLKIYTEKFPDSKVLRSANISEDAKPHEILEKLSQVSGMTDEKKKWYERNENLLKHGQLPIPFLVRHKFLLNVTNLMHLWEISKSVDKRSPQYLLMISASPYECRDVSILKRIPLIDETAILVLYDLGLLDKLFVLFSKVAISKNTIIKFLNWGQGIGGSIFYKKARKITDTLKENIDRIIQPSDSEQNKADELFDELENYKYLFKPFDNIFYTDDAIIRNYVCGDDHKKNTITTIDIIEMLKEKLVITKKAAAEKLSMLCGWNIINVPIKYKNILYVISDEFDGNESVSRAVEILESNRFYNSYISSIWGVDYQYENMLNQIGNFVATMISEDEGIEVANNIIIAIWYSWFQKARFIQRSEKKILGFIARSMLSISMKLNTVEHVRNSSADYYSRVWSIFNDLIAFIYTSRMTQEIEKNSIILLAKMIAGFEKRTKKKIYSFISSGLISGTANSELFKKFYTNTLIELNTKNKES